MRRNTGDRAFRRASSHTSTVSMQPVTANCTLRATNRVRKYGHLAAPPYTSASAMLCHRTEPSAAAGNTASATRHTVGLRHTYRRSKPAHSPYRMGGRQKRGL